MNTPQQLDLFTGKPVQTTENKRAGTFSDNMKLPIHRWFRYSAGFSAQWVESLLSEIENKREVTVLDPFVGSGTTLLAADYYGVDSVGIEPHPFVARVAQTKLLWNSSVENFGERSELILATAKRLPPIEPDYPELIHRCFEIDALRRLNRLQRAWRETCDDTAAHQLTWLALTAILRPTSSAGTAQWQYILPNKTKRVVSEPFEAFETQVAMMQYDMRVFQHRRKRTLATFIEGDARHAPEISSDSIDLVITSPPYANNYDYADATRFEMTFWGEVERWSDLHQAVRQYLIRSSSQHTRKLGMELDKILSHQVLEPIREQLSEVCYRLAEERLQHGGKKHYHTMIAAYFVDLARVWHELRRVCKSGSRVCFVIGDSAPYGIHVPVETWLGELAIAAGFQDFHFEKIRDRNIKWKNRKHDVPLHEGYLSVEG